MRFYAKKATQKKKKQFYKKLKQVKITLKNISIK